MTLRIALAIAIGLATAVGLALAPPRPALSQQSDPRPLTSHPAEDRAPRWRPDGERLFFVSDRDGDFEIYAMSTDAGDRGSDLVRVTRNPGEDSYLAFSPDGTRMVFQSERGAVRGLWIMPITGPDGEVLSEDMGAVPTLLIEDHSAELTPDWSPDGSWVAFTSDRLGTVDLWAVPVAGGDTVRLTDSPFRDAWPRFSPSGDTLVFFSRRDTDGQFDELYLMELLGGPVHRITRNPGYHDFAPDVSPDGGYVVAGISDGVGDRALAIYDLDGERIARFAEGFHRVFQPVFSPYRSMIAFAARRGPDEGADIYIVEAPGR